MKVVLLQINDGIRERIMKSMYSEISKGVIDTGVWTKVEEVAKTINSEEQLVIISGQVLCPFESMTGVLLAERVKSIKPDSLFYIFSVMPEKNEFVDGIIPKDDSYLERITNMLSYIVATSNITDTKLKIRFPEIC